MFYVLIAILLLIGLTIPATAQQTIRFDESNTIIITDKSETRPTSQRKRSYNQNRRIDDDQERIMTVPSNRRGRAIVRWKEHRMPDSVAEKLMEVERKFGPIQIISSCRPGATVKNTNRPSMHRYCRAVDFNPPKNKYSEVSSFLKRTWWGGVGTYSGRFNHIHIDDNRGRWHN